MKKLMMALMGMMAMVVMAACGNSAAEGETWRVGTSADYYPFIFIDEDTNQITGFDFELISEIAERMGATVEMVDMDFTGLIPALQTGRIDVIIAGMTNRADRAEVVDFTQVYHNSYEVALTTVDHDINSFEDLNGLTVGVQTGTIQEMAAEALLEEGYDFTIMSMSRIPELVQQVLNGRADVVFMDAVVVGNYLNTFDGLQVAEIFEKDEEGSAIALPLGSDKTEEFNAILDELREDGTLQALADKWFN
ncbi:MAG: ABC transporter substrate-binding protein [Turicibacter sp.]|nr:ABC transporter substrate-binding protein [Turicibacter sp.]